MNNHHSNVLTGDIDACTRVISRKDQFPHGSSQITKKCAMEPPARHKLVQLPLLPSMVMLMSSSGARIIIIPTLASLRSPVHERLLCISSREVIENAIDVRYYIGYSLKHLNRTHARCWLQKDNDMHHLEWTTPWWQNAFLYCAVFNTVLPGPN